MTNEYADLLMTLARVLRANVTGPGSAPHRDAIDAALRAVAKAENEERQKWNQSQRPF